MRWYLLVVWLVLATPSVAGQEDEAEQEASTPKETLPEEIEDYIQMLRLNHASNIRLLEARVEDQRREISAATRGMIQSQRSRFPVGRHVGDGGRILYVFASRDSKRAQLKSMRNEHAATKELLADLVAGDRYIEPTISLDNDTDVGEMGKIELGPSRWLSVMQVIDGSNMLVNVESHRSRGRTVWLSGIDTSRITDDENINFSLSVFHVSGTKTYTTAIGGSNTVLYLEVLPIRQYQSQIDEAIQVEAKKARANRDGGS